MVRISIPWLAGVLLSGIMVFTLTQAAAGRATTTDLIQVFALLGGAVLIAAYIQEYRRKHVKRIRRVRSETHDPFPPR